MGCDLICVVMANLSLNKFHFYHLKTIVMKASHAYANDYVFFLSLQMSPS